MSSNTTFVYTDNAMLKIIEEPDGVRLKICPRREDGTWDETDEARSVTLNKRSEVNFLVEKLRRVRNRIWGKDA